ncbi:MAG TPA: amidohydrolase family protein, partial [Bacteroidia bacterium]|nr:amidohydrolase family protein [Bacteroidia bacterium]
GERIITIKKNEVIEHGTIVIKDGRIIAIGPLKRVAVPAGAKVLDLSGKTIMPGIVDLHLHMNNPRYIFPQQSWMFLVNLAFGVTTARDPRTNLDAYGYAELLRTGSMVGPRLFPSGPAVYLPFSILKLDDSHDAIRFIQKRAELGGTFVKDYLIGDSRLQREWVLLASRSAGLNATNEGSDGIFDLGMIKDGYPGIEHNPRWGDVYKDITSFFALSGIYFTPTLTVSPVEQYGVGKEYFKYKYWHQPNEKLQRFTFSDPTMGPNYESQESWEQILKAAPADSLDPEVRIPATIDARIRHQGGKVGLGSHGNDEGIGAHNELWALQMGGLSNMEALQAATIIGAEAIGIQKDVGSLEVGKIADLIVLNKNPLDDIHNSREIKYVMKDGILYDGDTLDELWPVYKKCPEWKLKH